MLHKVQSYYSFYHTVSICTSIIPYSRRSGYPVRFTAAYELLLQVSLLTEWRRDKKDKLFGKNLIQPPLPPSHKSIENVIMKEAELFLYQVLVVRFKEVLTKTYALGSPENNLKHKLASITRIRQCVSTFFLNLEILIIKIHWKSGSYVASIYCECV